MRRRGEEAMGLKGEEVRCVEVGCKVGGAIGVEGAIGVGEAMRGRESVVCWERWGGVCDGRWCGV